MPLPSRQTLLKLGETLLIGTIGGGLLTLAGIPAGWLSGAMIAVAIAALAGRPMTMPAPLARVVFVLIGISLGGAVTPETLKGVATWPLSVVLLCVGMICAMFGSAAYLKKVHGWTMLSGLFGSAPGALCRAVEACRPSRGGDRGDVCRAAHPWTACRSGRRRGTASA
jgi:membrane AbrB-like protein